MTTDITTPGADDAPGPYDTVTIRDVFAWFDTLRGWDIATHVEYEALRNVALARLDALEAALRAAEAQCARLRRLAKAEIANACTDPFNPDQRVRQEVQEAREDCSKHGDLDGDVRRMAGPQRGREQA